MKQVKTLIVGGFLSILGFFLLLSKMTFKDPSNNGMFGDIFAAIFGGSSPKAVSGIMIVVILLALLIFAFSPNMLTLSLFIVSVLITTFTIIASLEISISEMNGTDVAIIGGLIVIGIAMFMKSALVLMGASDKRSAA